MIEESQKTLIAILRKNILFQGLSDAQLEEFTPILSTAFYDAGDTIIEEGDPATGLYIVKRGSVEVIKKGADSSLMRLTTLHSGECFGEMTMFDQTPRSATVRAIVPTEVVIISVDDLETFRSKGMSTYSTIVTNLAKELNQRLRITSDSTVNAIQQQTEQVKTSETLQAELNESRYRNKVACFFGYAVVILSVYCFLVVTTIKITETFSTIIAVAAPLAIISCYIMISILKKERNLLHGFGLTFKEVRQSLVESLLLTIPLILFLTFLKWLLIMTIPEFSGMSTFVLASTERMMSLGFNNAIIFFIVIAFLYCLFAFFQELFARGVMLTSLDKVLTGHYAKLLAIIFSSLIFLMIYTHGSFYMLIMMLVPNIVWGVLYLRHRTLVGVTISHALVGIWAFYLLGIDDLAHFVINS